MKRQKTNGDDESPEMNYDKEEENAANVEELAKIRFEQCGDLYS